MIISIFCGKDRYLAEAVAAMLDADFARAEYSIDLWREA